MTDESAERLELARIFSGPGGDARHQLLERFVADRPSYGEGHLHLGLSYMSNRFSAMLELPMSVVVLGGRSLPSHAPPEVVAERLERAEQHFVRAMELDPALTVAATSNIAAVKLARGHLGDAIAYIEKLMGEGERSEEPLLRQHLGTALRESGRYDEALDVFRSLVDSEEVTLVHRNLALTHLCQDNLAKADDEMGEQRRGHDSTLDRLLAWGVAAELRGDVSEARSAYEEIASTCRHDPWNQLLGVNAARRRAKLVVSCPPW
jgi:tetratricopeptide (TPR) repeat protein